MSSSYKHAGLEKLGYFYNDQTQLKQVVSPSDGFKWEGQAHYDALGDEVTEYIQDYMIDHYGLIEMWLADEPAEVVEEEPETLTAPLSWDKHPRSGIFTIDSFDLPRVSPKEMKRHAKVNIFMSPDALTNPKLLLIVQGSGAVRPGQWARALCINESLRKGTIFDYLDIAKECGMGVIVLNPNHNQIRLKVKSEEHPFGQFHPQHSYDIPGHNDHVKHILSIYDQFVSKSNAKHIWMVAHSRGGDSALQLLNHRLDDPNIPDEQSTGNEFKLSKRLHAIAFTDSVHWIGSAKSHHVLEFVDEKARDWVTSDTPLDTPIPSGKDNAGCDCVSAGHKKHEWTSPCAVNSVFRFFIEKTPEGVDIPAFTPKSIDYSNPPQFVPQAAQPGDAPQAQPNPAGDNKSSSCCSLMKCCTTTTGVAIGIATVVIGVASFLVYQKKFTKK